MAAKNDNAYALALLAGLVVIYNYWRGLLLAAWFAFMALAVLVFCKGVATKTVYGGGHVGSAWALQGRKHFARHRRPADPVRIFRQSGGLHRHDDRRRYRARLVRG